MVYAAGAPRDTHKAENALMRARAPFYVNQIDSYLRARVSGHVQPLDKAA